MNRGCRAAASIDGYNGIISDLALANRALAVVGVDVEPLIEALPAEEMAALGDDGVRGHVEADVALEVGGIAVGLVVGLHSFSGRHDCGGRGDGRLVCEWETRWL